MRPPNKNSGSAPAPIPVPAVAWARRKMVPLWSAIAPTAVLARSVSSVTMSGSVTLSMSWMQPWAGSVTARPTSHRSRGAAKHLIAAASFENMMSGRMVAPSESDVQSEGPVSRGRRCLEVAHDPGRGFEVVGLRVHPAPPRGLPKIPAGHRETGATRAEGLRPPLRQLVGRRGLAQPDERGLLDEAPLRARRRLSQRHRPRLLRQRGGGIDFTATVESRLAADALRAVELVEAALVIEQEVEPQPAVEQIEAARVRDLPARVRISDELRAVCHRDLVRRDDAVAVQVLERVGALEPRVDRVAHALLRRRADDRRNRLAGGGIDAHVRDEVRVVPGGDGQVPRQTRASHQ